MKVSRKLMSVVLCVVLTTTLSTVPVLAMTSGEYVSLQRQQSEQPSEVAMVADLFVARPLLLAATIAGTGVFIVTLPFSILGGNTGQAGKELVVTPAKATFARCLGCTTSL